MRLLGFQGLDHLKKVAHRTGQPVQTHHDQDLIRLDLTEESRKYWPGPACAGSVLLMDLGTACSSQFDELSIVRLILCGDAGVAD